MSVVAGTMVAMARAAWAPHGTPMVGRSRELDELRERFAVVERGVPQVVVIGGEAGIGKSRLVGEFAETLGDDVSVVVGHCLELGPDGPPFAPFVGILRELAAAHGVEHLATLAGPGRADLAALVPEFGGAHGDDPLGRGRLFEAIATLVERVATERPLVLVVEDLHWSDSATRDLLRFLTRTVAEAALLVVLTYRRDEVGRTHPLLPWLVEVDRLPHAHRISLERLDDVDVAALSRAIAAGDVPDRALARIRERSQGIPFFVEELTVCADGVGAIPETLRDLMLTRLDRLAPTTRQLLRVASAASTRIDHEVLLAVMDDDEAALDSALREAVGGQVLVVDVDRAGYAFRHALMREAVHEDLLPGEHARLHARYAEALEKAARPEQAGEIAHHWMSAHEADRAFEWSLRAADHSRSIYAWQEQMTHLERALDLWDQVAAPADRAGFDRAELLRRTSVAAGRLGQADRAIGLLDAALEEGQVAQDPARTAQLLVARAMHCEGAQRDPMADLERAVALAAPCSADLASALTVRASVEMVEARLPEARASAERGLAAAEETGSAALRSAAHNTLGCVLVQLGDADAGEAHLEQARQLAEASGKRAELFRYFMNYSDVLIGDGRFEQAAAMAREGRRIAGEHGLARTKGAFLAGNEVEALVLTGAWDEALRVVDEALGMDPPPVTRGHLYVLRAIVLVRRGHADAAADAIDRAAQHLSRVTRQPQHMLPLALARAEAAWGDGDADGALRMMAAAGQDAGAAVPASAGWPFVWAWGRLLLELGAPEPPALAATRAHLTEACPHEGWCALTRAQAAALQGDELPDWAGAVGALEAGQGLAHELVEARLRLAQQRLDAGDRDGARAQVELAWPVLQGLGAETLVPLAARVAASGRLPLPRDAGADRPRREAGAELLTPREREVLGLVAAGRSNGQIAEALFISVKTASVHVSNILAKLGVPSRTAAAAWAHQHLADDPA